MSENTTRRFTATGQNSFQYQVSGLGVTTGDAKNAISRIPGVTETAGKGGKGQIIMGVTDGPLPKDLEQQLDGKFSRPAASKTAASGTARKTTPAKKTVAKKAVPAKKAARTIKPATATAPSSSDATPPTQPATMQTAPQSRMTRITTPTILHYEIRSVNDSVGDIAEALADGLDGDVIIFFENNEEGDVIVISTPGSPKHMNYLVRTYLGKYPTAEIMIQSPKASTDSDN